MSGRKDGLCLFILSLVLLFIFVSTGELTVLSPCTCPVPAPDICGSSLAMKPSSRLQEDGEDAEGIGLVSGGRKKAGN